MQNTKYKISFFPNCYSTTANEKELTFNEIIVYFKNAAYREFSAKEQLEAMVCGTFSDRKRTAATLICRSIITYDIDYYKYNLDILLNYIKERLKNITFISYTTRSSTFEKPRLRLLVFVNKTMTPNEYRVVSKNAARSLFKEFYDSDVGIIDETSFVPSSLMYLPSYSKNFKTSINIGEHLDINQYLNLDEEHYLDIKTDSSETQEIIQCAKNTPLLLTDENVEEILNKYNCKDANYHNWLRVGQALHHQYSGNKQGLDLFIKWSLTDTEIEKKGRYKNDTPEAVCKFKYSTFKSNNLNPITFASIIDIVNKKNTPPAAEKQDTPKPMNVKQFIHSKENKNGEITGIKSTYENFEIMCKHYRIESYYDKITKEKVNNLNLDANSFVTALRSLMVLNNMNPVYCKEFCEYMSLVNRKNSFKIILDDIVWDGKSRLEDFYNTLEVEEDLKAVRNLYLLKWCQQMLYQSLHEGKKKITRNLLVLNGEQDIGKSSWVGSLLPPHLANYISSGMSLNVNSDMSRLAALKCLIVELGELKQSFKASDINQFKSFFGGNKDTINIKYVATPMTFDRTTSFIGTLNDDVFLQDRTGSTRFLVLKVIKVNGYHTVDMLQLYKEILETTDYNNFELSAEEKEIQRLINEEYEQPNLLEETFIDHFELDFKEGGEYMNCTQVLFQLGFGVKDLTYIRKIDIKHILNKYNFKCKKNSKKWLVKIKQGD